MHHSTKRWLTLVAVCLGLVLLGWVVASAELSSRAAPIPEIDMNPMDDSGASEQSTVSQQFYSEYTADDRRAHIPPVVDEVIIATTYILIAGGVVALLWYVVRRVLTTRPTGWDTVVDRPASQPDVEDMRDALRAGLSDMDAGGDHRKAVIACWLRLERVASDAGVARLESETPTDLVTRVLRSVRVSRSALAELTQAYHRARYAPHAIDAAEREAARAALAQVDAQLAAARPETAAS